MSSHQFANIAPAPQASNTMQAGQATMAGQQGAGGAQVMSPNGQPMQQMQSVGQFQLIPSQLGGNAQYAMPQIAAFNQQGQYVLQPANFAFQSMPGGQASGQQFTLIAAPQMQQQKPGQPMLGGQQQQNQQGKGMVPISMAQSAGFTFTGNMVNAGGSGTPQTFIMANPMGGAPIMATQGGLMGAQMQAQMKQDASKMGQQQQTQQQSQGQQQGQQQPIMMPQGVIMTSQGQPAQAIFQNGQIILRAQMGDGGQPQIMFQSPPHGMTTPGSQTQQLPPGMSPSMQPLMQPPSQMRPASTAPSGAPPGKTPISRSLAPILPTTSTSHSWKQYSSSFRSNPSPKGKNKVSPRGTGQVGRPPGSKSSLTNLKAPPPSSSSPPVLQPNSPHVNNTSLPLGPSMLQNLVPLDPARSSPNSMPPTLQPMLPSSGAHTSKPNDGHPPVLLANGPVPSNDSSKLKNSSFSNRKSDDFNDNHHHNMSNGGDSHSSMQSSTPKAVVKPNVLTHVIDGHIIQESSQPFPLDGTEIKERPGGNFADNAKPVNGTSMSSTFSTTTSSSVTSKPLTSQTTTTLTSSSTSTISSLLGNRTIAPKPSQLNSPSLGDLKSKISSKTGENQPLSEKKRGPGRPPGSTKQNLEANKTVHTNGDIKNKLSDTPPSKKSKLDLGDNLKISTQLSPSSKPSMKSPPLNIDMSTNNPLKWTVTEVCNFVKSLPGCAEYVEDFQLQEIDGQALMLLKTEHLMTAMSIRLGPALKICSAVDAMREQLKQN